MALVTRALSVALDNVVADGLIHPAVEVVFL